MRAIRKLEYTQPTPIQAQTAAFIWPLLVHILDQPALAPGDGPIGVILAPTRELSQQIYAEAKRFAKPYGITVVCAYGGGSKYEQSQDLEAGAEIVVATPGRMIDFVKAKATNFLRTTYLVLDEADRMFDMGFEVQVRSICNHVRPDRQTLMFSATFKKRIEKLARDVLTDPIRIIGDANADITQDVHVFRSGSSEKWDWLLANLVGFTSSGSLLIFVTKKANAVELAANIESATNFKPLLLHGDMNQVDRNGVITAFKRMESRVLVATDVAARGLDIAHIRTVVNYDDRDGRGARGLAVTLVTEADREFVGHLVRNLEGASQPVPEELMTLAMGSSWFRKSRFKGGSGKKIGGGGAGGAMRSRPGLGAPSFTPSSSSSSSSLGTSFVPSSSSYSSSATFSSPPSKVFSASSSSYSSSTKAPESSSSSSSSTSTSASNTASDRAAAIKAAYRAQFRSQFQSATDTAWDKSGGGGSGSGGSSSSSQQQQQQEQPKKKSRWG
ncbi:ATP-dependent RNA helicase ddx42 [Tyrophagus putrescentiae]|nr:ATP-dependent RNA helicase ddx42 [Tyrophagus putrescentiae]